VFKITLGFLIGIILSGFIMAAWRTSIEKEAYHRGWNNAMVEVQLDGQFNYLNCLEDDCHREKYAKDYIKLITDHYLQEVNVRFAPE
jgi:hypothetical protein